ncbi:hypothetical protein EJB05_15797, partial [Eragrostis curvula]
MEIRCVVMSEFDGMIGHCSQQQPYHRLLRATASGRFAGASFQRAAAALGTLPSLELRILKFVRQGGQRLDGGYRVTKACGIHPLLSGGQSRGKLGRAQEVDDEEILLVDSLSFALCQLPHEQIHRNSSQDSYLAAHSGNDLFYGEAMVSSTCMMEAPKSGGNANQSVVPVAKFMSWRPPLPFGGC